MVRIFQAIDRLRPGHIVHHDVKSVVREKHPVRRVEHGVTSKIPRSEMEPRLVLVEKRRGGCAGESQRRNGYPIRADVCVALEFLVEKLFEKGCLSNSLI